MTTQVVTMGFRESDRNPGHVVIQVFAGRNVGARAQSGSLLFRTDEWDEAVRPSLLAAGWDELQTLEARS